MTEPTELQLDRAEFDEQQPAAACATCATALTTEYYEVNGNMVCTACRSQLDADPDRGTRVSRLLRALGAGSLAAIGGSLLYWAILAITGYEFGLIAVVVGIAVGKAVNWGSRGKGGWRYQTIAMTLTYLAMVSAYVPLIIAEVAKQPAAQTQADGGQTAPVLSGDQASADEPSLAGAVIAIVMLAAFVCAIPFLAGIENILGILILGFGLYEAWKRNRRVEVVITGPHAIATPEPA
jgi:hypothetical protein